MNSQVCVKTALAAVLEELAFMFADPPPLNLPVVIPEALNLVSIHYTGEHEGTVWLLASSAFCLALHENMIGSSDDDTDIENKAADAFKELCNVVTGQMVTMRFGTQCRFTLSIPALRAATAEEWKHIVETCGVEPLYVDQEHFVLVALEEEFQG